MTGAYPKPVRVLLDATVVTQRSKGAGRVIANLARALPAVDPGRRYLAATFADGASVLSNHRGAEIVTVPDSNALRWERHGLAEWGDRLKADAIITVREVVFPGGPPVVLHLAEPPAYRLRRELRRRPAKHVAKDVLLQALLAPSVRRAAAVTAASEATANWLRERYRIDPPVIPPGIDPFFLERDPAPSSEPYLLHPATGDRRENTDLVLRAYAASTPQAALVLVGVPPGEVGTLTHRAKALGIDARSLRVHGWVTDEELRALYRGAIALVHPARYEGFAGLQPLEAMAQGTVVIALEAPGVTEALSGLAELVPEDAVALGAAMRRVSDPSFGSEVAERGVAFATSFTWERAARSFVSVLDDLERERVRRPSSRWTLWQPGPRSTPGRLRRAPLSRRVGSARRCRRSPAAS
jgi:glycosyltransferase involved in cell wall biosynthesis